MIKINVHRRVASLSMALCLALAAAACSGGGGDGPEAVGATAVGLREPAAVAVDASGNVYIADTGNCSVHLVTGNTLETIVGDGRCSGNRDGGLGTVGGIVVDAEGVLYVAESSPCRVRRWQAGEISPFAGNGECGSGGDGGPAIEAQLDHPAGLALDASGNLYIADARNCRIRLVAEGTMTTAAGVGRCGFEGDGGPAAQAALDDPTGIAVAPDGTLFIVEAGNCRVRSVSAGVITTLAGDGSCAFGEAVSDPAAAGLGFPRGIALATDGTVYVADTFGCRVLALSAGALTVAAGDSACGFAGDGGPAASAQFDLPAGVAIAADGTLFIADTQNCRVRAIRDDTVSTVAGRGCE